jgi:hypothetical protein
MTNSERLSHTLVAIPIAHVLGSAFYLYSYCFGFGANLVVHASVSDLVSVSIKDMVPVYLITSLFPLMLAITRLSFEHPYAESKIESLPIHQQPSMYRRLEIARSAIKYFAISLPFVTAILVLWEFFNNYQFSYMMLLFCLDISFSVFWLLICNKKSFGKWSHEVGMILIGFIVSLFCIGAANGQKDRFISYDKAKLSYTSCHSLIVIRQLSSRLLVVMPNNARGLTSDDCKLQFNITAPNGNSPDREALDIREFVRKMYVRILENRLNPPTT